MYLHSPALKNVFAQLACVKDSIQWRQMGDFPLSWISIKSGLNMGFYWYKKFLWYKVGELHFPVLKQCPYNSMLKLENKIIKMRLTL